MRPPKRAKYDGFIPLVNVDVGAKVGVGKPKKIVDEQDKDVFGLNAPYLERFTSLCETVGSELVSVEIPKRSYERTKIKTLFVTPNMKDERQQNFKAALVEIYEGENIEFTPPNGQFCYPSFKECNKDLWEEQMGVKFEDYVNNPMIVLNDNFKPLEILSMVATLNLCVDLNIEEIAMGSDNVSYKPKSFAPLVKRIFEPRATLLIFTSGKVVVSGPKSEDEMRRSVINVGRVASRFGYRIDYIGFKLTNISAASSTGFSVNITEMAKRIPQFATLRTELFSGLIYNLSEPPANIICFHSGSMLLTGAKSEKDMRIANEKFQSIARCFRKLDQ